MWKDPKELNTRNRSLIEAVRGKIECIFGDDLSFALVFGSRARNEYRKVSDLDLVVVFKDSLYPEDKIKLFEKEFLNIQESFKLDMDYDYPGEYLSEDSLSKAIMGYGFVVDKDRVEIPPLLAVDWNRFFGYRQWLCAIGGVTLFIVGNYQKYLRVKISCQRTILLLHLLTLEHDFFNILSIMNSLLIGGKTYLGYCNTPKTREYITKLINRIMRRFEEEGIVEEIGRDTYKLMRDKAVKELSLLTDKKEYLVKRPFLGDLTTQKDKDIFNETLDWGLDYILEGTETLKYYDYETLRKRFNEKIPITGVPMKDVLNEFKEKVADGAVHQSSPRYLAFPDSGNSIAGLQASILANFMNQNLISMEKSSPTGTFLEIQVIQWLRNLVGYPESERLPENISEVGGIGTTGGTMSNTIAVLLARCKALPSSRKYGLSNSKVRPILLISDSTLNHYSHISSAWWLGLGEENVVTINGTADYKVSLEDLENKILKYSNNNEEKIIALIVLAGDSRTTQIDKLDEIADIAEKYNIWLHVDACHGGVLLFSGKYKNKLKGLERADSVSIDPHKGLGLPYASSFVLFRNPKDTQLISQSSDITITDKKFDLGQISPFVGSKPFDSLKLWFLIKNLGVKGLGELVEYRFDLAKSWHQLIENSKFFANMTDVNINSIAFSVSPLKVTDSYPNIKIEESKLSNINKRLHDEVYREGFLCIHNFELYDFKRQLFPEKQKLRVLGVIFGNPYISKLDFPEYISYLDKKVENIINSL